MHNSEATSSSIRQLAALPWKALRRLRQQGLRDTIQRIRYLWDAHFGDWRHGIQAAGFISRGELGHDCECVDYDPISYRSFQFALSHAEIRAGEDVFLDFGCGMGRAVVMAARHPFRKIIGVEKSTELCGIAEANIARIGQKLACREIQILNEDARTFAVPDEVTIIYMFNPFTGSILTAALEQIAASLARRPRRLTMLYILPALQEDPLAATDWLIPRVEGPTEGLRFVMYEHVPEPSIRKSS